MVSLVFVKGDRVLGYGAVMVKVVKVNSPGIVTAMATTMAVENATLTATGSGTT